VEFTALAEEPDPAARLLTPSLRPVRYRGCVVASLSKVRVGETLDDRFTLTEQIGCGGMSTVFKGEDRKTGKLVAVKVPLPQFASGIGSWSMFQREAQIGRSLEHPAIVQYLEEPANGAYVVTEFLEGTPLSDRVGNGRRLEESEALSILSRLCDAVAHLHARGFVHYDLKPANVMERPDGALCLIDLGMAHAIEPKNRVFGAPAPPIASANYVAPEQIRRRRGQPSVDIYALGAMLYELVTGHAPFEDEDPFQIASSRQIGDPKAPRALVPELSREVEEVVLRALRRDPTERYASAAEFKNDLDNPRKVRVSGLSEHLVPVTGWRKNLRRVRYVTLVAFVPLGLLVASFRLLWWYLERKP
jgi:serine/threonine-protein kinase